ncbi:Spo0E family sporulation regulatory protein-aspartic acid phosphatase [Virgibacillus ainsalahensis]
MDQRAQLETKIEQLRSKMYKAFETNANNEEVIHISQELDRLLNKLDKLQDKQHVR